jgi:hypothetical protein
MGPVSVRRYRVELNIDARATDFRDMREWLSSALQRDETLLARIDSSRGTGVLRERLWLAVPKSFPEFTGSAVASRSYVKFQWIFIRLLVGAQGLEPWTR